MHANTDDVVVVTGATGNVGRPVAERLLAAGHPVRVVPVGSFSPQPAPGCHPPSG